MKKRSVRSWADLFDNRGIVALLGEAGLCGTQVVSGKLCLKYPRGYAVGFRVRLNPELYCRLCPGSPARLDEARPEQLAAGLRQRVPEQRSRLSAPMPTW